MSRRRRSRAPRGPRVRIVGGRWAGRPLRSPADFRVRPTAEHVRGAILDFLEPDLAEARVLDLFAGTGALGLEALSRGAATAHFVETRPTSLAALRANVARLGARARTRVFETDALPFAAALGEASYDLAFADPPYESRMLDRLLDHWRETRFAPLLVAEHALTHPLPAGWRHRAFDSTAVTIYRL